jgi:hypothetical protein
MGYWEQAHTMIAKRKVLFGFAGAIGIIAALLAVLFALAPWWIRLEPVKARILSDASRILGGTVTFERLELFYFPRPRIVLRRLELSIPGKSFGKVETLIVYPSISSWFRGGYPVGGLKAEEPDFRVSLPEKRERPPALAETRETVRRLLAGLSANAPSLAVEVEKGRLLLSRKDREPYTFRDIQARAWFPPETARFEVRCASDLWESLSASGSIEPKDLNGRGHVEIAEMDLDAVSRILPSNLLPVAYGGSTSLGGSFTTAGLRSLDAVVRGAIPSLSLRRGGRAYAVKGIEIQGTLRLEEGGKTAISLSQLAAESPLLRSEGNFLLDEGARKAELAVRGGDIDLTSLREALLALAGDVAPLPAVLAHVRGGKLSSFTLENRGETATDLAAIGRFEGKGRYREGSISVPAADLRFEAVEADVTLSRGILAGTRIRARSGSASVDGGNLALGVTGKGGPFRVEGKVRADASEILPIVQRFTKNPAVREELSGIDRVQGRAEGRLLLGDRLDSIHLKRVEVTSLQLSARYRRIPYPIELDKGRLLFEEGRIATEGLAGRIGSSSFSGVAARLRTRDPVAFEGFSGNITASLGELHPWILSWNGADTARESIRELAGTLHLSIATLEGPAARPREWRYEAAGSVKALHLSAKGLPGPVEAQAGNFRIDGESISFAGLAARFLDADVRSSGLLRGYRTGLPGIEATVSGSAGQEAIGWVWKEARIPAGLTPRAPVAITEARVAVDRDGGPDVSTSGTFRIEDGPSVSLDLRKRPGELDIRSLVIKDAESTARTSIRLKDRELEVAFAGSLAKTTLNRLLVRGRRPHGWIGGDIRVNVPLDRPADSRAQGRLEAKEIYLPRLLGPLSIEALSLAAAGNRITVASSALAWGETRFSLSGDAAATGDGVHLDMNLTSDGVVWDNLARTLREERTDEGAATDNAARPPVPVPATWWPLPVTGTVRINANSFTYRRYVWKPARVDFLLEKESITAAVREADLCGIATTGAVKITPADTALDIHGVSAGRDITGTLDCVRHPRVAMTGTYKIDVRLSGKGNAGELARSLSGTVDFRAEKGRIHKANLLSKLLAILNVTQLFFGKLPDLGEKGFAYNSMTVRGDVKDGSLGVRWARLDAASMNLSATGEYDFLADETNLTVLASPLKTIDTIIRKIPVIRYILRGSLVAVPVQVTGKLDDPTVFVLSPAALGSQVLGIFERTLKAPIRLFQPGKR